MWKYYHDATGRSWDAAWEWATGQGIYLTWLFAIGVVACAAIYATIRAVRKHHSWGDAMSEVRRAIKDFILAAIGASAFVLLLLFVVFFVRDAPTKMMALEKQLNDQDLKHTSELEHLRSENQSALSQLKDENNSAVEKLNIEIADLK